MHRSKRKALLLRIVVEMIAVAQQRNAAVGGRFFAEQLIQRLNSVVRVFLKRIAAPLLRNRQRIVPFVARLLQQRHQAQNGVIKRSVVYVELVEHDFVMGAVGDESHAVAVEDFAARGGGVGVEAGGAGRQPLVFAAVHELPIRQTRDKNRGGNQRDKRANGKRQLAAQLLFHLRSSFRIFRNLATVPVISEPKTGSAHTTGKSTATSAPCASGSG